jgi:tRNA dimethylallyltransferase
MNTSDSFPIQSPIVALIGPTAIGKTALSIELAQKFDFEIISVDSMQVYRYMDIGTAKITEREMEGIPHHLISVVNPDEIFNAGLFEKMAIDAVNEIVSRGKNVLLTGGTGLYLSALLNGLLKNIPVFPELRKEIETELEVKGAEALHKQLFSIDRISAKRIHPNDSQRLVRALEIFKGTNRTWSSFIEEHRHERESRFTNTLIIGLRCEREKLYHRIDRRSEMMLENGLHDEVKELLEMGYGAGLKSMKAIGYSHMVKFINGEWTQSELLEKLSRDTRRYAKRQFTWFNKINKIDWVETENLNSVQGKVSTFFKDTISTT